MRTPATGWAGAHRIKRTRERPSPERTAASRWRERAGVITLALFIFSIGGVKGQVYFDNLYGDSIAGGGVPPGGTLVHGNTYLIWATQYEQEFWPSPFFVDFFGNMIIAFNWPHNDSVGEQLANVIPLNDSLFVGLSLQTINTQSSSVIGDPVLTCFYATGQIEWRRAFGPADRRDVPHMVVATIDSSFVITGQSTLVIGTDTDKQMTAMKINQAGYIVWEQFYGGSDSDWGSDLLQTPDSGFLLLGWTRSYGAGQRDFYLVKTDNLGNQQWQRTYGGSTDEGGSCILELSDGNYLLTGSGSQGNNMSIGRMYKIDPTGNVIWANTYSYSNNTGNNLHKSIELWNGSLISAGLTDLNDNAGWLLCTDSSGEVLWQREYNKNNNTDLFYSVLLANDGGFLLSGQARNAETNSQDAWLLKVDSVGCPYPNCTVGIDEAEPTKVVADVWPNPVAEMLNIEWQNNGLGEVRLFDLTGKEALRKLTKETQESLDVSTLPNGLYLLTLIQGEAKSNLKIVVQR